MSSLAKGQSGPVDSTLLVDSVVTHMVGQSMFGALGEGLARAAFDTVLLRPWQLLLPDSIGMWGQLRTHLWLALRGRPAVSTDRTSGVLRLEALQMQGDTLRARFYVGSALHCATRWMESGTHFAMSAVRHRTAWEYARTNRTGNDDSFGCPP